MLRLPCTERIAALKDPATVERMVAETGEDGGRMVMGDLVIRGGEGAPTELVGRTLGEVADSRGERRRSVSSTCRSRTIWTLPFLANSGPPGRGRIGPMLAHPLVHIGASDGGAHVASFSTYGDTGYLFSDFVRETHT